MPVPQKCPTPKKGTLYFPRFISGAPSLKAQDPRADEFSYMEGKVECPFFKSNLYEVDKRISQKKGMP
jgi:hypothetical protein